MAPRTVVIGLRSYGRTSVGSQDSGKTAQPIRDGTDTSLMTRYVETRWTQHGKDRVYVKTPDGVDLGYADLVARTVVPTDPQFESSLHDCLLRWMPHPRRMFALATAGDALSHPDDNSFDASGDTDPVQRQRRRSLFARTAQGRHGDIDDWRLSAKAGLTIGRRLDGLGHGWRVLHNVDLSVRHGEIDHLVVGPPGVFTVTSRCHPGRDIVVSARTVTIDGHRTAYLSEARDHAREASHSLTESCGWTVEASAIVVLAEVGSFTVRQMPEDVAVVTAQHVVAWLRTKPARIAPTAVDQVFRVSRQR